MVFLKPWRPIWLAGPIPAYAAGLNSRRIRLNSSELLPSLMGRMLVAIAMLVLIPRSKGGLGSRIAISPRTERWLAESTVHQTGHFAAALQRSGRRSGVANTESAAPVDYHCIQLSEVKMPSANPQAHPAPAAKPVKLTRAQRTAILKALSDPKRFELLEKIARSQCPLTCSMAGEALAISAATLSHHIKELQTSGLIDVRREGKFAFLTMKPGVLEALSAYLQSLSPAACTTR